LGQVTIFSGAERRRRWSIEQKRTLISAAFAPGAVVTKVAQAADVHANQLYRWRRELGGRAGRPATGFAEIVVTPEVRGTGRAPVIQVYLDRARIEIAKDAPAALVMAALKALTR
jgi:transposase